MENFLDELRFYFGDLQFLAFAAWLFLVLLVFRNGSLTSKLGMTGLLSVSFMIGYICLISFGVLGAGYSPGILFPSYDAFIEPFIIFFFGVPAVMFVMLLLYIFDSRRRQPITILFTAFSIYLLWSSLMVHVGVISSI